MLKVEHKRKEFITGGADPTLCVRHTVKVYTKNHPYLYPLLEVEVIEFQDVYTTDVRWKTKLRRCFTERKNPRWSWLGRKWHQWLEREEHCGYRH